MLFIVWIGLIDRRPFRLPISGHRVVVVVVVDEVIVGTFGESMDIILYIYILLLVVKFLLLSKAGIELGKEVIWMMMFDDDDVR